MSDSTKITPTPRKRKIQPILSHQEETLIGIIMRAEEIDPSLLKHPKEWFGVTKLRLIYETLQELDEEGKLSHDNFNQRHAQKGYLVDEVSRTDSLQVDYSFINELIERWESTAEAPAIFYRLNVAHNQRLQRAIALDLYEKLGDSLDYEEKSKSLGLQAIEQLNEVIMSYDNTTDYKGSDFISGALPENEPLLLPTGLKPLDVMFGGGLAPTDLTILAGRPSDGKSALAVFFWANMLERCRVLFITIEMSGVQVTQRLLSYLAKVPLQEIRNTRYKLDPGKVFAINNAVEKIKDIRIIEKPCTIPEMQIRTREIELADRKPFDFIIIDYLQIIPVDSNSSESREQQVAKITKAVKLWAKTAKVPILVLSQLNRKIEEREDRKPQLSDLRESGSIEQEADNVLGIWKRHQDSPDIEIMVLKQRNGPTGRFSLYWESQFASFKERS